MVPSRDRRPGSLPSRFLPPLLALSLSLAVGASFGPMRQVAHADAPSLDATEVRGLWVLRDSLASPATVSRTVREAASSGFNTLFVQVRGRGDAYFRGGIEPLAPALRELDARFDPLDEIVRLAHAEHMRVHAWMNVNLISSASNVPSAADHLVNRRPEWLMVPRSLATELRTVKPASPGYVRRLAAWSRRQREVEGLFASPILPGVADHVAAIAADIVSRYDVDGVHLDYVRYPTSEFDYSQAAIAEFRSTVAPDLEPAERARLDLREQKEPFIYADMFPTRWLNFRRTRLTALVMRVRAAVKGRRSEALVSAAVVPDSIEAQERRLQDWGLWFDAGLLDAICPMVYTPQFEVFTRQIDRLAEVSKRDRIWPGIGAYRLSPAETATNIEVARRAGMGGIVLFSYDSLRDTAVEGGQDYLTSIGRLAFDTGTTPAGPAGGPGR